MFFLKKGWGENKEFSEAELSAWNRVIEATDCEIAEILEDQKSKILQVFRYKLEDGGYRVRCVYELSVRRFAEHEKKLVAKFSGKSKDRDLSLEMFGDGGMISELYLRGISVNNPRKLEVSVWQIEVFSFSPAPPLPDIPDGWVKALLEQGLVGDFCSPFEDLPEGFEEQKLPAEYVEFNKLTNGCRILSGEESYELFGYNDIVAISSDGCQYLGIIDLRELGAICIDPDNGKLLLVDSSEKSDLDISLEDCIKRIASDPSSL
jgi:hypothetical protein